MKQVKKHKMISKKTTMVLNKLWLCAKVRLSGNQVRVIHEQVTIIQNKVRFIREQVRHIRNRVPLIGEQVRHIRNRVPLIGEQVRHIRKQVYLIQNKVWNTCLAGRQVPNLLIPLKTNFPPMKNALAYNLFPLSFNCKTKT